MAHHACFFRETGGFLQKSPVWEGWGDLSKAWIRSCETHPGPDLFIISRSTPVHGLPERNKSRRTDAKGLCDGLSIWYLREYIVGQRNQSILSVRRRSSIILSRGGVLSG